MHRIILKHCKTLIADQDTEDIFNLLSITSYKREHNLSNHLVCASESQPHMLSDAGTFSCNHDCLPILMLLYIMLYIVLAYLMLFAALTNAVCLYNASFFAIDFCKCFLFSCFVFVY